MLYIFDIDGVLADITNLLPLITGEARDYDTYYGRISEPIPIELGICVIDAILLKEYDSSSDGNRSRVHFVTGRNEISREATMTWLKRNLKWDENWYTLHMRSGRDRRPAWEVKHATIQKIHKTTNTPFSEMVVFEDDSDCVDMYVKLGCYVNHVKHAKARS